MTAFLAAFSLIVQLFAGAAPHALAQPAFAGADDAAAIAAELRAVFGGRAELCLHVNDDSAPAKRAPPSHCCDQCLCRASAQALALVPPDLPALPPRLEGDRHAVRPASGRDALPPYPAQPNPARAPPLAA